MVCMAISVFPKSSEDVDFVETELLPNFAPATALFSDGDAKAGTEFRPACSGAESKDRNAGRRSWFRPRRRQPLILSIVRHDLIQIVSNWREPIEMSRLVGLSRRSSARTERPRTRPRRDRSIRSPRSSAPPGRAAGRRSRSAGYSGVADGDSLRKVAASSTSSRLGAKRGGDRVGGSGRAADAGKAVDDERRPAVPASREIEQRAYMTFARRRHVRLLFD